MKKCMLKDSLSQGNKKSYLIFLGLLSVAFMGAILYSGILHAPFVFDDYSSIVDNETIKNLRTALNNFSSNRYFVHLSFAVNYFFGGLKPFGFHLINNLIHAANGLLVFYLVILTFRTPYFRIQKKDDGDTSTHSPIHPFTDSPIHRFTHSPFFIAFSTAFIFVAHPIQTQAVTYIAQRATSMATMFYLLSLVMYIKWRLMHDAGFMVQDTGKTPHSPPLARGELKGGMVHRALWIMYLCSLLFAVLAMKTKEIAFTLPVVIALYEFSFFSAPKGLSHKIQNWKRFLYLFPILLTILIIPLSMIDIKMSPETIVESMDMQSRETANFTRADYSLTQLRAIVTYLRLLILPINQNLDYRYPIHRSFFDPQVFLSFLFLLSLFGVAVYLFYRSRLSTAISFQPSAKSNQQSPDSPIHRFTDLPVCV